MSVEVVNEVAPANDTILLNCTLPDDGIITWFHDDKEIVSSDDDGNYKVVHGNLNVTVGQFFVCIVSAWKLFLFLAQCS